jgi:prefoldin subunit 5
MDLFKKYLVLGLLLVAVCSQTYDQSANLQQLESKILAYQADLAKLQRQVQRLKRDLSEAESTTIKIGALNEVQADERDALISINSYLNLPFKYSQCECVTLSNEQRQQVNQQIKSIRKQLKSLKYDVSLQERCTKMDTIRSELERQLNYL